MPTGRRPYAQGIGAGTSLEAAAIRPAPSSRTPTARAPSRRAAGRPASAVLLTREREERQDAGALHGLGNLRLVTGARARDPARHDLPAVGDEPREPPVILVIDPVHLVETELAELTSKRSRFAFASHPYLLRVGSQGNRHRAPKPYSAAGGAAAPGLAEPASAAFAAASAAARVFLDSFTASTVRCR